jgi:hypothetical protein
MLCCSSAQSYKLQSGGLEAIMQRVDGLRYDRDLQPLNASARSLVGAIVLVVTSFASGIGVVALIGTGYGTFA